MMVPTIHLNGTSAERLLEALEAAYIAVGEAQQKLAEAAPNGRDYYPQGADALYKAQDEHFARMQRLEDVKRELQEQVDAILAQQQR